MVWVAPQFSRVRVNAAGEVVGRGHLDQSLDYEAFLAKYLRALEVVNNWRSSHSFPLNTFTVRLKRHARGVDPHCIIAQRIKRLSSIQLKLERFKTMTLSQMQDLGGCRAVVASVPAMTRLVKDYRGSDIKHPLSACYDYFDKPKTSGYRGVHLVYRYNSDRKATYNGLRIEIQIRTHLQHAWATAVETVGRLYRQSLKSSQGDTDLLRFFALASSAFAFRENSAPVPDTPASYREMVGELREYVRKLDLVNRLSAHGEAMRLLANPQHSRSDNYYFLLEMNPTQKSVEVATFKFSESKLANAKYLEVEKNLKGSSEAVLVSVDSLDTIRKAYPNYFLDTHVFMSLVGDAMRTVRRPRRPRA